MPTTTLTCKTEIIERSTLSRYVCARCEIHQFRVRSATICTTIVLDQSVKLLPLTGDREVAGITLDRNREIHDSVLI